MINGQDWASYQSDTPSTSGLDFVFIKATEGNNYINPRQGGQAATARTAGLVLGFYHFLRPGSMTAQAAYFVASAASVTGDILAADWEDVGVSCADKDAFLKEVKRLRPGHKVVLYCNTDFWKNRDTTSYAGDGLWIADPSHPAGSPGIQAPWTIHQYSSAGGLDRDVAAFASRAAMKAWAAGTPSTTPEDPMPTAQEIADAVLNAPVDDATQSGVQAIPLKTQIWNATAAAAHANAGVQQLAGEVAALQATGLTDAQIAAIAAKVADVLGSRLKS